MKHRWTAFLIFILFIYAGVSQMIDSQRSNISNYPFTESQDESDLGYFTESSPILIDSNRELAEISNSGTGAAADPYIIERLYIESTGTQNGSLIIRYTSTYFVIRDCYFKTDWVGIVIRDVSAGTAILENNTCISNSGDGAGIVVWGTQNCTIVGNRCSNLSQGIHLNEAGRCYIAVNNISDNNYQGINIRYSHSNVITANLISNSSQHGVALVGTSRHNVIHHNQFVNNSVEETYRIDGEFRGELTSQGFDEGSNNTWYDTETEEGNWWSDYSGYGSYEIDGTSASVDQYPNGREDQLQSPGQGILLAVVIISFLGAALLLIAWRFLYNAEIQK